MELPFLKNKNRDGGGGPSVERKPDQTDPDQFLEHVGSELMAALSRKDQRAFISALTAFLDLARDQGGPLDG